MTTNLQKLSSHSNSWRKFSLKKILVLILFFVVLVSFTIYAYAITVLIPVGILPFDVAINLELKKAYVAHADGTVHVINTDTNAVIKIIPVSPGNALTGITVNPDTEKVYVANGGANEVAVIDGNVGVDELIATIPLISPLDGITQVGIFPIDVEVNTNLCRLYVSNVLSLTVVIINLETVCNTFPTGIPENQIIDVLLGTENALTDDYRFDSPARFAFDDDTGLMYMTSFFKNEVSVLDGSLASQGGFPVLPPVTVFPGSADGIAINGNNHKLYVANPIFNKVSIIDVDFMSGTNPEFNTLIGTIDVGLVPVGIGVDESNNRIYVGNKDEGTLSVIDGSTDMVIKTIPTDTSSLTPRPKALDVSDTGKVYVANAGMAMLCFLPG
jgi:YVTN family beta-propeller protein